MIECPFCGMEMHSHVRSREYDEREYSVVECSYCGYSDTDSKEWLDEGWEDREPADDED